MKNKGGIETMKPPLEPLQALAKIKLDCDYQFENEHEKEFAIIQTELKENKKNRTGMKLSEVHKYTTVRTLMEGLTKRQRAILYKQCKGGRSCYLTDVNFNSGYFYEHCFDSRGEFNGEFLTSDYLSNEYSKPYKALKILKNKQVNMRVFVISALLNNHETPDAYNFTVSADKNTALTQEEWDLLKEMLKDE